MPEDAVSATSQGGAPPEWHLTTSRLLLRQLEACDAEAVHAYRSDAEVARYQSCVSQSVDGMRASIAELATRRPGAPGWFQVGLTLVSSSCLIGDCGMRTFPDDQRLMEIGITLAPRYQGRGLATEAILAILGYVFTELAVHRVCASVDPRNVR